MGLSPKIYMGSSQLAWLVTYISAIILKVTNPALKRVSTMHQIKWRLKVIH